MSYKISDSVAMRFVQIFQEAVLLGVDGADLMRQVRLVVDESSPDTVTLCPQYEANVREMHEKYLEDADKLRSQMEESSHELPKLIFEN
jgi:hypothetical protein